MADDAALVARFLEGDQQALGDIYERHADRVYDLCRSILHSDDDAADAFQDTFLTAAGKLHQLRDRDRLRPWLYSIARNQCRARIRARGRTSPVADAGTDVAVEVDMSAPMVQTELAALVADAWAGLNERDQEILDLHMRHGLEGDDLADVLGVSTQSAYKLVQRVRGRVERSMGALLVARHAATDCEELSSILDDSDGEFSPLDRKRISRHVDGCEICGTNRRRLLDPSGLASAMPFDSVPSALHQVVRTALLAEPVPTPNHELRRWRRDGFPGRRRGLRRFLTLAGIAVLMLATATGVVLATDVLSTNEARIDPADVETVESVDVDAPAALSTTDAPTTTSSTTTTSLAPVPSTTTTVDRSTPAPPAPTPPAPTPTTTAAPPATTASPTTSTTTTTTTTTTTIPDTTPPAIAAFRMNPVNIYENDPASPCGNGAPSVSNAEVDATDTVDVASVVLNWTADSGGSGRRALTDNGTNWTGGLSFPRGTFLTVTFVTVRATATDLAGNTTTGPTTFQLEVVPCL